MGKRIEVDLRSQRLSAFEGHKRIYDFRCFTGDDLTPTDRGHFRITWKDRNHISGKYHRPMHYALFFTSDGKAIHAGVHVAIRSFAMRTGFGRLDPLIPDSLFKIGSHGCVNLNEEDARRLFDWAPENTPVLVR
jgi:lipoprotein-anchoring transpeptidase ErfK/SrfK